MSGLDSYIFVSERLGFRNWQKEDLEPMVSINSDPLVMAFFPSTQNRVQTAEFIERMQKQYIETGFTYFAVDRLDANEFIGFIGLSRQTYEAPFTPCVDIGWRLTTSAWQSGYATEGAIRCLAFALDELQLDAVYAVAPKVNKRSERVMIKAGMQKIAEFNHPLLTNHESLNPCVVYKQTGISPKDLK